MIQSDLFVALQPVIETLEALGVPYYVSGSIASSAYGFARATLDVDMVAPLTKSQVSLLVEAVRSVYYVSDQAALDAVDRLSSFNLIHLQTMIKVDLFILPTHPFDQEAFQRRRKELLVPQESFSIFLGTPEDILLHKLRWYLLGGSVSDQQWKDVLGILKVQGDLLDYAYLQKWAKEIGTSRLLHRALEEVGRTTPKSSEF